MNKRLVDVVKNALEADNTIVVPINRANGHPGFSEAHFEYIGVNRNDLKKLERAGLALRGYTELETATNLGRRRKTTAIRWLLVGDAIDEQPNN